MQNLHLKLLFGANSLYPVGFDVGFLVGFDVGFRIIQH